jgi:hypothetical protein
MGWSGCVLMQSTLCEFQCNCCLLCLPFFSWTRIRLDDISDWSRCRCNVRSEIVMQSTLIYSNDVFLFLNLASC